MPFLLSADEPLAGLRAPVLTIGTFDGVHLGHRLILDELRSHAAAIGGESVVITFEPHPRAVLQPGANISILTPLNEKLRFIADAGIDHVCVTPFTKAFSGLSAAAYIEDFLVARFHPSAVVIGYDHHFGHDRAGDLHTLREAGGYFGFSVYEIPAQLVREAAISSTRIRHALVAGEVHEAAAMLGRPYAYSGTVIRGDRIGRTLGYPTANLSPLDAAQLLPAEGIYAVRAEVDGTLHQGMLSIGTRPTINDAGIRSIEVNLFDFDKEIYGSVLTLYFIRRLRGEEKFDSLEALKEAMRNDEASARRVLSEG